MFHLFINYLLEKLVDYVQFRYSYNNLFNGNMFSETGYQDIDF